MEGLYKLLYKNGDWELEPALAENSELSKNVFTIEIKKIFAGQMALNWLRMILFLHGKTF
jgi:hypothetical protein